MPAGLRRARAGATRPSRTSRTFSTPWPRPAANPVFNLLNEPLLRLLKPSLAVIIDRVPQARSRIEAAQEAIVRAVRSRDAKAAADWMARHVRDFRRGYEVAGIDLATEVGEPPVGAGVS